MPLKSLHVNTPMVTISHLLATQWKALSTTLPFIELWSPIVPNKTNLIDPVYKNLIAAVKELLPGFFIYLFTLYSHLGERATAWGTKKLGLLRAIQKGKDAEEEIKAFKIRSVVSTIYQRQGSSGVSLSNWTFKTAGTESTFKWTMQGGGTCCGKGE